ncbi:TPA: hypothetical protein ACID0M_005697 [Pseudomonas aeruginosa]
MSFVAKSLAFDGLLEEFDLLINSFRKLRLKIGKGAPIESTKLWGYRKKLDDLEKMDEMEVAALIGIVNKYRSINALFDVDSKIIVPQQKLLDLLDGGHTLADEDERYNDAFFELAMAIRFAASMGDGVEIDLSTECDVVLCRQKIAIECKYLHSERKFRHEFSDAIKQLDKRISNGQAEVGYVAYDLTNLVDKVRIFEMARSIFDSFAANYERLEQSRGVFSQNIKEQGLLRSILVNRNFQAIISNFTAHHLESVFYSNFKKSEMEKLDSEKVAVIFQLSHCLIFEYDNEVIPVPARAMNYYINDGLPEIRQAEIKKFIHSLAVGI